MGLLRDAFEATLSTAMSGASFLGLLALASWVEVPELPEIQAAPAPLEARFVPTLAQLAPPAPAAPPATETVTPQAPTPEERPAPAPPVAASTEPGPAGPPAPALTSDGPDRLAAMTRPRRPGRPEGDRASKHPRQQCEATSEQIRQIEEDRWDVDKELMDFYVNDLREASTLAWVGWHRDEADEIDGFRVRRIKCGSVLWHAGLRNGDVVHRINGRSITTIPEALRAYRRLKRRDNFMLYITRQGEVRRLRYTLT
ncbi:MAG: hypothetical protein H6739_09170 [Alphaproteobacteria bacterium]|nr:hypothetical protein [Alphaproteobacteria bacterium]